METLQINKANALKAYNSASPEMKEILSNLFGKDILSGKITDRIKTFEDACTETDEDPNDDHFSEGTDDEIAFKKLKVIARALNEGWVPNWNKDSEYKWYPWFYLNNPGFRFYDAYYVYAYSYAAGGSRLCFKSEELAIYAGKQFLDLYKQFID